MQRLENTIQMAKASWQVLQADKELLVLPAMSLGASAVVAVSFFVPFAVLGEQPGPLTVALAGLAYIALAFVTVFFNTAVVSAAHERLNGGDPTLRSALAGSVERLGAVFVWSLITGTVSLILKSIEERAGFLGALAASIAGLAWTLVTFLVIPVIVVERMPASVAVRRSAQLFKQTWGENVIANLGFGLLGFVAILPAVAVLMLGIASGIGTLVVTAIVVAVVWGLLVTVAVSALTGIFQTALYLYATTGAAPGPFASVDLQGAFRPKQRLFG